MQSNEIMISVIIATYNRKDLLREMLDSILMQTEDRIEIIIVDDCSKDGTGEFIKKEMTDARIHYYRNPQNSGPGYSRRYGYERSRGKYVIFADDDDFYTDSTFFAKVIDRMEHDKEERLAFVGGTVDFFYMDTGEKKRGNLYLSGEIDHCEYLKYFQLRYQKPIPLGSVFRRSKLEEARLQDVVMLNDGPIHLRALLAGNAYIMEDVIGCYRQHSANISTKLNVDFLLANMREKWLVGELFPQYGVPLNISKWWYGQVYTTMNYYVDFSKPSMSDYEKLWNGIFQLTRRSWIRLHWFKRKQKRALAKRLMEG